VLHGICAIAPINSVGFAIQTDSAPVVVSSLLMPCIGDGLQ
jgi:hypothetical protein